MCYIALLRYFRSLDEPDREWFLPLAYLFHSKGVVREL